MRRLLAGTLRAALLAAAAPAGAATIHVSGSSTARPLVADLAYFYRQENRRPPRFTIVGGGTEAGIADAARGIVDVGMASRALLPADPAGLVFTPFAASGVCLVTNGANPLPVLTRAALQDLVSGRAASWAQIAGSAAHRRDRARRARSRDRRAQRVRRHVRGCRDRARVRPAHVRHGRPGARLRPRDPGGVGLRRRRFTSSLHVVPYEGVDCTRATIARRRVPGPAAALVRDARAAARRRGAIHPLGADEPDGAARDRDALRAGRLSAAGRPARIRGGTVGA